MSISMYGPKAQNTIKKSALVHGDLLNYTTLSGQPICQNHTQYIMKV